MKKTKIAFAVLTIIYSAFFITIIILKNFNITIPFFEIKDDFYTGIIFYALAIIFSIIVIIIEDKGLSLALLIISFIGKNPFGIVAGAISLYIVTTKEKAKAKENTEQINNIEKQRQEIIEYRKNVEEKIEITNKYNYTFISSIIILSLYFLLYLSLIIYTAIKNFDVINSLINPSKVFDDLGPGAMAFIIIYPVYVFIFLFFSIILLIPIPYFTFSIIMNVSALKKDINSYQVLKVLGIINLTFINSYRSFKICDDIKRQKAILEKEAQE